MIWGHAAGRWPDNEREHQAGGTYLSYLFLLDITTMFSCTTQPQGGLILKPQDVFKTKHIIYP